jgi:hypothetical protein
MKNKTLTQILKPQINQLKKMKMGMPVKVVAGAVAAVFLVLVFAAFQPDKYDVSRAIIITAPVDKVFPEVNNFQNWPKWSAWEGLDPDIKRTYEGPDSGTGAVYHWAGNGKVGEGTMTIVDSQKNDHITVKVEFLKPFHETDMVYFVVQDSPPSSTYVGWDLKGENDFSTKIMHLFMDTDAAHMNKVAGGNFQDSLEGLKALTQPGYHRNI